LFSDPAKVGQIHARVGLGQPPAKRNGLLGGGQRLTAPARMRQPVAEVVQRRREVGQIHGGVGLGQPPVIGGGLLGYGQRLGTPARLRQSREIAVSFGKMASVGEKL
jgi:hypothetical protein